MDAHELRDYLVVHSDETDPLYVLHRLQQLDEAGAAGWAVDSPHSWKGVNALVFAASKEESRETKLVLELLLLKTAMPVLTIAYMEIKRGGKEWAAELMEHWVTGRWNAASDARWLLEIGLQEAADWLDLALPPHPRANSLTGLKPLPPRPPCPDTKPQLGLTTALPTGAVQKFVEERDSQEGGLKGTREENSGKAGLTFAKAVEGARVQRRKELHFGPTQAVAPSSLSSPSKRSHASAFAIDTFPSLICSPIPVHVGHLPACTSRPDLQAVLAKLALTPSSGIRTKQHGPCRSFHFSVRSKADYLTLRSSLHGQDAEGRSVVVEREAPSFDPSHPVVHVKGLGDEYPLDELEQLARKTGSGAYDCEVVSREEGKGRFRCASPAAAEEALAFFNSLRRDEGSKLEAALSSESIVDRRPSPPSPRPAPLRVHKGRYFSLPSPPPQERGRKRRRVEEG
ncbi:hypothetical protein JCM10213v2_005190 [Rhodosporidiobolus nylandii]